MGERAQALSSCIFGFSTRRAGFPEFLATGRVFLSPTALDPWLSQEVKPLRRALPAPVDYDQILIAFAYERNAQTGMFTNLFLHREQFGTSFAYDDDKNLISTSNLAGEKSKMEYDDFDNLTGYVRPGAAEEDKYLFTYGDTDDEKKKHLVRTESTPMGVKNHYTYDAHGNRLTAKTQKDGEPALIQSETAWNSEGNYAVSSTDARGHSVVKTVDPDSGLVYNVTDPTGQSVAYSYDSANRVTGVQAEVAATDSEPARVYKNAYTYENDRIKTVSHNTTGSDCDVTYTFDYDDLGRKTTVKVGSQTLSTNVYANDRGGLLKEVQYGNGGKVSYEYDEFDRMTGVKHDGETSSRYEYEYGANGRAAIVRDHHLNRTVQTEYDLSERPCRNTVRDAETGELIFRTALEYDEQNRLKAFREETADGAHETTFTYDKDNRTTQIRYGSDEQKVEYTYDGLGRIASRKVTNGASAYETEYEFVAGDAEKYGAGATTPLVKKIVQPGMNFEYEYDSRGNIISEKRNGAETKYAYDALGQLIYVNAPHEGAIWYYKYDQGGNILEKRRYARSADGTQGALEETIPYEYGDANWKDKLTKYNGQTITYDAIGNPLDDGERRYEWEAGRRLKKVWVRQKPEDGIHDGVDGESNTTLRIQFTNGNLLTGETTATTVSVKVLKGEEDITSEYAASAFVWTRDTGNAEADATWNAAHDGVKEFTVSAADLTDDMKFTCTLTGTSPDYGTVYVDENMNLIHSPAEADANDTLHLENCILSVETPNNEYHLDGNVLSVIRHRLNGSVAAEAWVYTAESEKLVEFEYDSSGLRTQKKVTDHGQTVTTNYIYNNKLLVSMICRMDTLHFFYDANSRPTYVMWNGDAYYYIRNLQNDIVGIIDSKGNIQCEYLFSGWGNVLVKDNGNAIAYANPFRYRSYVYDDDINLHYIQERFYSESMQRFLNPDTKFDYHNEINGHNVFIYCKDMPINNYDVEGKDFFSWISNAWEDLCFEVTNFFSAVEAEVGIGGGIGFQAKVYGVVEVGGYAGIDTARIRADDNALTFDQAIVVDAGVTLFDQVGVGFSFRKPRDPSNPYNDIPGEFDYILGFESSNLDINGVGSLGEYSTDLVIGTGVQIGIGIGAHADVGFNLTEWQDGRERYYHNKEFEEKYGIKMPRYVMIGMGPSRRRVYTGWS